MTITSEFDAGEVKIIAYDPKTNYNDPYYLMHGTPVRIKNVFYDNGEWWYDCVPLDDEDNNHLYNASMLISPEEYVKRMEKTYDDDYREKKAKLEKIKKILLCD